jgi:hypothetical protein
MPKRTYIKKSAYWEERKKKAGKATTPAKSDEMPEISQASSESINFQPLLGGEGYAPEVARASYSRVDTGSGATGVRTNRSAIGRVSKKYSQISQGLLPWQVSAGGIDVRDAVLLCQKAYSNIAVFRNTVDMMAEFANTEIYLEGGTAQSRAFFEQWMKRVKMWAVKDQYFREYYRSGNIFLYRIDGKIQEEDLEKLRNILGVRSLSKVPLKYTLLNPYNIKANSLTASEKVGVYAQVMSKHEIIRLKNSKNPTDQRIWEAIPVEVKKKVNSGQYANDGVTIDLEPDKLHFSFFKKQDYEPFAIPFGFPVLDDINAKMEMKRLDQAIMRTVENVILLFTMGDTPDKGGINHNNLRAMQDLFKNESVGRVLVSDYTTKANFIVPDIAKVVGPQKYEVLNQDIKDGLQNIILSEDKYNGAQMKARVFLDRLKEARNAFINDFLQPEIERISSEIGFQKTPEVKFQDIDLRDEVQLMRVATRLMELGIVTPEQGMELIKSGRFPLPEELEKAQEKFIQQREKKFFNPVVGGIPMIESAEAEKNPDNNASPQLAGRPEGSKDTVSREQVQASFYDSEQLLVDAKKLLRGKYKKDSLSKEQEEAAFGLCSSIICAKEQEEWLETLVSCVKEPRTIENLNVMEEISKLSHSHDLDLYPAAILYHANAKDKTN